MVLYTKDRRRPFTKRETTERRTGLRRLRFAHDPREGTQGRTRRQEKEMAGAKVRVRLWLQDNGVWKWEPGYVRG